LTCPAEADGDDAARRSEVHDRGVEAVREALSGDLAYADPSGVVGDPSVKMEDTGRFDVR
jgi:hypothetical protein